MMEGEGDAAAIGMPVMTVAPFLPMKLEAVVVKRGGKAAGRRRA